MCSAGRTLGDGSTMDLNLRFGGINVSEETIDAFDAGY
jgi:hypothetical protein